MCILKFWRPFIVLIGLVQVSTCAYIILYGNSMSNNTKQPLDTAEKILQNQLYDRNKINFIFVAGLGNKKTDPPIVPVIETAIEELKDEYNVFLCDWEEEAAPLLSTYSLLEPVLYLASYVLRASLNAQQVGSDFGKALARMAEKNFSIRNTILVGHSLGAHISGFAAKRVQDTIHQNVSRVIGLDPASPLFNDGAVLSPLSTGDAELVWCWHTDNHLGTNDTPCDIDTWFNPVPFTNPDKDQRLQPGCKDASGSHSRVWELFIESIKNTGNLVAARANTLWDWIQGKADCKNLLTLGLNINQRKPGVYYLNTSATSPFGLGRSGACPKA